MIFNSSLNYTLKSILCVSGFITSNHCSRAFCIAAPSTMPNPKRYFINNQPDYTGGEVQIDKKQWKEYILKTAKDCIEYQPCNRHNYDGGLYVGNAGIAYMFYYLSQAPEFSEQSSTLLKQASEIIKFCLDESSKSTRSSSNPTRKSGFLIGNAGIYAVGAAINYAAGNKAGAQDLLTKYAHVGELCIPIDYVDFGGDEFLVGRAGYLAGAFWMEQIFKQSVLPSSFTSRICDSVVESGIKYSKNTKSRCPLMYFYHGTEYLGAAHGLCSILQMLITNDKYLFQKPEVESDVKESIDFLLSLQGENGNFPCAMDEIGSKKRHESDELVHWCHGAPGVIYLMAKAYLLWKHPKYLESCKKSAELVWKRGLLRKGPGICHGVAGNGYVFLLMYRITKDQMYLHRANEFAKFMLTSEFKSGARTPDTPYSLYEGLAGTCCFLADLLQPEKASFPFMNVF